MTKTFVICEVACTWESSVERAKELIDACAAAGADAVKFQWCSDPAKMATRRHVENFHAYDALNWPQALHGIFADLCADAGVEYMCTAYNFADIGTVAPFVSRFKIASLEAQDEAFVLAHVQYGKTIYVSTGCMNQDTLNRLAWRYRSLERSESSEPCMVQFLQCVSAYPAMGQDLNLRCLDRSYYAGLSDHTANAITGALAVMAGAKVLEVHVRHDLTTMRNPDFPHSLTVDQLRTYIANVRYAEAALGDGIKTIQPSEEPLVKHVVKG